MKYLSTLILFSLLLFNCSNSTKTDRKKVRTAQNYFNEIQSICTADNGNLWGFNLYSPILFVDPETRNVYANENGTNLAKTKEIFTGKLPAGIVMANTKLNWDNKQWNLFVLPLPSDSMERRELIIQQLYRSKISDSGLGKLQTPDCNHLNESANRIWMKIEVEALKRALLANDPARQKEHIRMALAARKMRKLFTGEYFIRENNLDLKEGLPKLTWLLLNGKDIETNKNELLNELTLFQKSPFFMRSFAELLIPTYGLFMSETGTGWFKKINEKTDMTDFIIQFYQIKYHEDFDEMLLLLMKGYNGDQFEAEEEIIAIEMEKISLKFQKKFLESPFVMIKTTGNTHLEYHTDQLIPFYDKGTIYLHLTVTDIWGTVTITDGALINTERSYIYLSAPFHLNKGIATGEDWKMNLNEGYGIQPYLNSDKFIVAKD